MTRLFPLIIGLVLTQSASAQWVVFLPHSTPGGSGWVVSKPTSVIYCTHLDSVNDGIIWFYSNGSRIVETWDEYYARRGILSPAYPNCQNGRCFQQPQRRWRRY